MPSRYVFAVMTFFASSALLALGFLLFGPLGFIRTLGLIALVFSLTGLAMQWLLLRELDTETQVKLVAQAKARFASAQAALHGFAGGFASLAEPDPLPLPIRNGSVQRLAAAEWIDLRYDADDAPLSRR